MPPSRLLPLLLVVAVLGGGAVVGAWWWRTEGAPARATLPAAEAAPPPIRSMTLDARRKPEPGTLARLRALGVTHVTLIPFAFQPRGDVPELRVNTDGHWYAESDAGIRELAVDAAAHGMGLILKPHVWIGQYSVDGQERHKVGFATEAEWADWEAQYAAFLLHYARLAEEVGADVLVVGTELAYVARTREAFWRRLVADVRAVYGGRLTYAANWWEEYEDVPFWDALDYIGVQAYFPVARDTTAAAYAALHDGWAPHLEALARLQARVDRPVLFTELGYRSVPFAAAEPWRWPSRDGDAGVAPAYELQADLYRAFFERFWGVPWFAGVILWKWYPGAPDADRLALDFSPQDKPAEAVIERWFTRRP